MSFNACPSNDQSFSQESTFSFSCAPRETPSPRKGGMSEEQVKFARDLSTVTNSVLKFLALVFQVREIYGCFSGAFFDLILYFRLFIFCFYYRKATERNSGFSS